MTDPLSPKELAACREAHDKFWSLDVSPAQVEAFWSDDDDYAMHIFAAALDYLRAEMAKEEPVARVNENYGLDWLSTHREVGVGLYLHPSEPTPALRADVLAFLRGEAPLDGVWFGDAHPVYGDRFWWRVYLRDIEPTVPEGYALVPVEPTPAMMDAYRAAFISEQRFDGAQVYKAMIAAAKEKD
jgi:hypothetical protein